MRTIATAFDTVVRRDGAIIPPDVVRQRIRETSDALGIVRHLVTLYLNEKALADPACPYLIDRSDYGRLCARFARVPATRSNAVDILLDAYLQRRTLPASVKAIIDRGYCPNARYTMSTEMVVAAERHVGDMFEDRVTQHIACRLELCIWEQRDRPGFDKFVKRAAKVVLQAVKKRTRPPSRG